MSKRSGVDFALEAFPVSSAAAPASRRKKLRRSVRMGSSELRIKLFGW
jgi:hypothetical protein